MNLRNGCLDLDGYSNRCPMSLSVDIRAASDTSGLSALSGHWTRWGLAAISIQSDIGQVFDL